MTDYEILGVSKKASQEEIKKAYRATVKQLHPDVNDAPNAAAMFRLVQEAYQRLRSDAGNKKETASADVQTARQGNEDLKGVARNTPKRRTENKVRNFALRALRFVLMLPILAALVLLLTLCSIIYFLGGAAMYLICGLFAILTLFALFQQEWQMFWIQLILTWACSPLGIPGLVGMLWGGVSTALGICWAYATN